MYVPTYQRSNQDTRHQAPRHDKLCFSFVCSFSKYNNCRSLSVSVAVAAPPSKDTQTVNKARQHKTKATQHNTTKHNTAQDRTAQHNTTQHNTIHNTRESQDNYFYHSPFLSQAAHVPFGTLHFCILSVHTRVWALRALCTYDELP